MLQHLAAAGENLVKAGHGANRANNHRSTEQLSVSVVFPYQKPFQQKAE
jgi:hypothetical protein